ncbi:nucleolar protein dao-5-like isoform X2 [Argiope bruennichi]|uniref:Uncharacterized protein n=1 Tax=Argiope bruennichi TaxID=94029 RepID=A0A8T0EG31_ARGBR|nr:nucleolar protein dao-5-like isoform X2 [Argiope bruennichi]KAF8771891.1 hypothetical protein HNY73_019257 [Argiope bruennichi]
MGVLETITCCILALVTLAVFRNEFLKVKDAFVSFWVPRSRKKAHDAKSKRQESNKENLAPQYNTPIESSVKSSSPLKTMENGTITKEIVSQTETMKKTTEEKEGLRIKSATLLPDTNSNSIGNSFENFTSQKLYEDYEKKASVEDKPIDPFPSFSELLQTPQGPPKPPRCPIDSSTSSKTEEIKNDDNTFTKTTTETKHEIIGNTEVSFTKKEQESVSQTVVDSDNVPSITLDAMDLNDLINATQKKLESFKNGIVKDTPISPSVSSICDVKKTEILTSTSVSETKTSEAFSSLKQVPFSSPITDSTNKTDSMVHQNQSEPEKKVPPPPPPKPKTRPQSDPLESSFKDCLKEMQMDLNCFNGGHGFSTDESSTVTTETPFSSTTITKKKKMFSSSSFYEEPGAVYPTLEEQVEMARKIADSLADDSNKKSKGSNMFYKRLKKSSKWIHEGPEPSDESGPGTPEVQGVEPPTPDISQVPFRPSKGPPKLKLVLDPRHPLDAAALRSSGLSINEHNVVSPEVCHGIVKDLQSPVGKGAALFAKRKKKSEEWVVDEEKVKAMLRENERKITPITQQPCYNQYSTFCRQEVKLVKSPWEAAIENPYGFIDSAFTRVDPDQLADTVIKAAETKRRNSNTPTVSRSTSRLEGCMSPPIPPVTPAAAQYDIYHAKPPRGWMSTERPIEPSTTYQAPESFAPLGSIPETSSKFQNGFPTPKKMVFQNFNTVPRKWKPTATH